MELTRHVIEVSYPRITNRKMSVVLNIRDWHPKLGFYYPVDAIDNEEVMVHVKWKLGGDINWLLLMTAELDMTATEHTQLNLQNWKFHEAV